jgi:hypothetical protein
MIDQNTGIKTLENWKREGIRVFRRRTEYVYTKVENTPFSVAIASPKSFGRYYIDISNEKDKKYDEKIKKIDPKSIETLIQLYSCSYQFNNLLGKLYGNNSDYCIKYLQKDSNQISAIKLDLKIHNIVYNLFNYSMYLKYPNLVKSSFYGTYSGKQF